MLSHAHSQGIGQWVEENVILAGYSGMIFFSVDSVSLGALSWPEPEQWRAESKSSRVSLTWQVRPAQTSRSVSAGPGSRLCSQVSTLVSTQLWGMNHRFPGTALSLFLILKGVSKRNRERKDERHSKWKGRKAGTEKGSQKKKREIKEASNFAWAMAISCVVTMFAYG